MFCPKCGAEYRPGFTECADCFIPLVAKPPKETAPDHRTLKGTRGAYDVAYICFLLSGLIVLGLAGVRLSSTEAEWRSGGGGSLLPSTSPHIHTSECHDRRHSIGSSYPDTLAFGCPCGRYDSDRRRRIHGICPREGRDARCSHLRSHGARRMHLLVRGAQKEVLPFAAIRWPAGNMRLRRETYHRSGGAA